MYLKKNPFNNADIYDPALQTGFYLENAKDNVPITFIYVDTSEELPVYHIYHKNHTTHSTNNYIMSKYKPLKYDNFAKGVFDVDAELEWIFNTAQCKDLGDLFLRYLVEEEEYELLSIIIKHEQYRRKISKRKVEIKIN